LQHLKDTYETVQTLLTKELEDLSKASIV